MKSSFGMSNFLEVISGLSHSVVFLYFLALIIEEGFLLSPCYLELCIQIGISFEWKEAKCFEWSEAKGKGEKERYTHLNAEFQRIASRDKKAFLGVQCKETEENNRMGKTRDLFKKKLEIPREHFM